MTLRDTKGDFDGDDFGVEVLDDGGELVVEPRQALGDVGLARWAKGRGEGDGITVAIDLDGAGRPCCMFRGLFLVRAIANRHFDV